MQTFNDENGRAWAVSITIDTVRRVRLLTGINLVDASTSNLLERLLADPVMLCDVLFAVVKPDADAKGITDSDFGSALAGDVLDAATTALLEALTDFFPKAQREILKMALGQYRKTVAKELEKALAKLDAPEPTVKESGA